VNDNNVRPLPMRLRPLSGEPAESYVRRLAKANHLRPSYLRRCLTTPEGSYGPIQPDKLAAVAGRALHALLHALPDLVPRPRGQHTRRDAEEDKRGNQARRRVQFAAIRRDARAGLSGRAIERKRKVGYRTVRKALACATPPARKKMNRQAAVLHELHHHIDTMIGTDPAIPVSEVWERLVDELGASASYGAIRAYVARHPGRR
jgi:hypothetical protein